MSFYILASTLILASALTSVLIDVSLAMIALVIGFVSALWYVKTTKQNPGDQEQEERERLEKESQLNEFERSNMAANQLKDLASNMAHDVSEHNSLIDQFTHQLTALSQEGAVKSMQEAQQNTMLVVQAISQVVIANEKLQTRLEEAESKINAQAHEINVQQSEARTDSLTQLANRRAFDDALATCIKDFQTANRPCTLLIFDVDHFKQFNDTHGHLAGDEVLRCVGSKITQVVKSGDLPCRYGGEEFAVVMRGTGAEDGRVAAERIRQAIESTQVEFEGKKLSVTASIGLAELGRDQDSKQLIRHADEAVYAAKEAGRNCGYWKFNDACYPVSCSGVPQQEPVESPSEPDSDSEGTCLKNLPDQKVFSDELNRRISESHRSGVGLSLLYLQVKDYLVLEAEFGNALGAMLLDLVAQFTKSTLRDMDSLGKLEKGAFAVMLPGSSINEASIVGSRIQSTIASRPIPLGERELSLEVLWGMADVGPGDDAQKLIAKAYQDLETPVAEESHQIMQVQGNTI